MCNSQPASKDEFWTLGSLGLMSSRQEFDRLQVARAEETEVAPVEGREFRFAETFHDRQHGGIDESDIEVPVGLQDLADPVVVGSEKLDHLVTTSANVRQQGREGVGADVRSGEVVRLDEDRRRDEPPFPRGSDQLRAFEMARVAGVESCDERAGV